MKKRKPLDNNDSSKGEENEELVLVDEGEEEVPEKPKAADASAAEEINNKYLRLYAEFDNYKKRVNRDKEELIKYGNESLLNALLPAIDNLELALKHAACDPKSGVVQGVEITLKELQRTLEKFGLAKIEARGKQFDPTVHHAMVQVERGDMEEKMVAEELRPGYFYYDKVLRPSLVAVSAKPKKTAGTGQSGEESTDGRTTGDDSDQHMTNENIEEEV